MTVQNLTEAPPTGQKTVLLFWAPWHEGSVGPMSQILEALDASSGSMLFARVEAEQAPAVSKKYQVTMVPTFVLMDESGAVVERMEGVEDVAQVTQAVARLQSRAVPVAAAAAVATASCKATDYVAPINEDELSAEERLKKRLDSLIRSSEVQLFMKGNPMNPKCGFSRQAVAMLMEEGIAFSSFDIMTDDAVRQGLKTYSNWPTYPQLYVHGELIGGLDIMKEMKEEGSLREQLGLVASVPASTLEERLKQLVKRSQIVLFMKGLPSAPKCGFSRQIVDILNEEQVAYDAFDILQDEEVRQGLKTFSDWPTFPQLYVAGEFIGGLDIVKEMKSNGSLHEALFPPTH